MNKHKKNIEALRRHLGRDSAGLLLMDAVARDLNEQRKRLATLEDSESCCVSRAKHYRKELDDAQTQIAQIQEELQWEKSKRVASDTRAKRAAERIEHMESDPEAEDESASIAGLSSRIDDVFPGRLVKLFKSLKKRYNVIPKPTPVSAFDLDDLVKDFSGDEFMGLGRLTYFSAVFYGQVTLVSERKLRDTQPLPLHIRGQMARWMMPRIRDTPAETKLYGPMHRVPIRKKQLAEDE